MFPVFVRRQARMLITPLAALAAALLSLPGFLGCAASSGRHTHTQSLEPRQSDFDHVPVVQILTPWGNAGSAVRITDQIYLTARHVLPRRSDLLEINGRQVRFERLAAGAGPGPANDWAFFSIADDTPAPNRPAEETHRPTKPDPDLEHSARSTPAAVHFDLDRRVPEDEEVYLVGYWRGARPYPSRAELRALKPTIIRGLAIDIADSPAFPSRELLYIRTGEGRNFPGASGGPALVWDPRSASFVIIGLYVGSGEYELTDWSASHTAQPPTPDPRSGVVQIVRRLPQIPLAHQLLAPAPIQPAPDSLRP